MKNRQFLKSCPWCGSEIEKKRDINKGLLFLSCIECEFEIELEVEDLIEDWKENNIRRKVEPTVLKEESKPTTLVDCPVCSADDDDCWCCLGSGSVWEDPYGERIAKIDNRNSDGFDY